jgi:predicted ester cyclase
MDMLVINLSKKAITLPRSLRIAIFIIVCAIVTVNFAPSANAGQTSALDRTNKDIALRFAEEGWGTNSGWEKVWDELVDDKIVYHFNSSAEPIVGLEANKQFNVALFQGFPDIKQKIEDVVTEGDKVVYRTTLQGTQTGDFLGIPPTKKPVKVNDFTLLRIKNDKIVEMWYETNLLETMNQLGLLPESLRSKI